MQPSPADRDRTRAHLTTPDRSTGAEAPARGRRKRLPWAAAPWSLGVEGRGAFLSLLIHGGILVALAVGAGTTIALPAARDTAPRSADAIALRLDHDPTAPRPLPPPADAAPAASPEDPTPIRTWEDAHPELRRPEHRPLPSAESNVVVAPPTRVRSTPLAPPSPTVPAESLVSEAMWDAAFVPADANAETVPPTDAEVTPATPEEPASPEEPAAAEPAAVHDPVLPAGENRAPKYPRSCVRAGHEGTVVLELSIDVDGRVTAVAITTSSGCRHLDDSARETARTLRYRPAMEGNSPVAGTATWTVEFRLEE